VKINYLYLLFSGLIILFAACTKISSTEIGTGLIPAVDNVNTKDTTITVYVRNAGTDTIYPAISDDHVVGMIDDPLFGKTDARINFQLSLPSSSFHFESTKDKLFFDSVVLVLSYKGGWGDTSTPVMLNVDELTAGQSFQPDTSTVNYNVYKGYTNYNNTDNFTTSNSLTDNPVTVNPTSLDDSIYVFQDSGINMIRIPLSRGVWGRRC
jgi:hypothetical protein